MDFFDLVETSQEELPLPPYTDVAWDFDLNKPIFENGTFKMVKNKEALKSWIYRALKTPRYQHEIYSWNHGSELDTLMGKPFNALYRAEAERLVKEALEVNPYVNQVTIEDIKLVDRKLVLKFSIDSVYGELKEDEMIV